MDELYRCCRLCPRNCGINRSSSTGFCGMGSKVKAAKAMLHKWEEPCISYKNGAGTVFFSGCSLHCIFCQNSVISSEYFGREISTDKLADIFLSLCDIGADNIELVTPTHFVPSLINALDKVKHRIDIPIVYNTGGYEKVETIKMLSGYIDVYLPDLKYFSSEISQRYSSAPDYFQYASEAVTEMTRQVGKLRFNADGGLVKGTVIRHLVLPSCRHDSIAVLDWIAKNIDHECALVSIMSQYTPFDHIPDDFSELKRRVTKLEYNSVVRHADELGLEGFMQEKSSSDSKYIPDFDLSGI